MNFFVILAKKLIITILEKHHYLFRRLVTGNLSNVVLDIFGVKFEKNGKL